MYNVKYPNTIGNSNFASSFNENANVLGGNSYNAIQLNQNYSESNLNSNNYINTNNMNNSCSVVGTRSDIINYSDACLLTDFKQNFYHKTNMLNNSHANFNNNTNHFQMQQHLHQVEEQNNLFQNQKIQNNFNHQAYLDRAIISNYRSIAQSSFYSNDSSVGQARSTANPNLLQSLHLENQFYKDEPQVISSPITSYNANFNTNIVDEAKSCNETNFFEKKTFDAKKSLNNFYNGPNTNFYQNYSVNHNDEYLGSTHVTFTNEQPMNYYIHKYNSADNLTKNEVRINKKFGLQNEDWINNRLRDKLDNTKKESEHGKNNDSWSKASDDSDPFRNGATLRERNRMHILNDAFDDLRKMVPKSNSNEHQRLSKIATLRHAINYISYLTNYLQLNGGCKPVDASTLPAPPRRRRRRKFPKVNTCETNADILNNTNGSNQKIDIKIEMSNQNLKESNKSINATSELEIKVKKKKIKLDKKKIKN